MYNYPSRREKQNELIEEFLKSDRPVLELRLYKREMERLEKDYPDIVILQAGVYKDSLLIYHVLKKKND